MLLNKSTKWKVLMITLFVLLIGLTLWNFREKRLVQSLKRAIGITWFDQFPHNYTCQDRSQLTKPRFYSQSSEDIAVYTKIFSKPYPHCHGTYLEIGALDGVRYSNTLFYEQFLNWTGVLIEAQPSNYAKLRTNRPHNWLFGEAVCNQKKGGSVRFAGSGAVGGVFDEVSDDHKKRWFKHNDPNRTVEVPCRPLSQMLNEARITSIDLFSLDVEGSEYFVLQTMDWNIPVKVFIMEYGTAINYQKANQLLLDHGYRQANWTTMSFCIKGHDCASNRVYLHPTQPDVNPSAQP